MKASENCISVIKFYESLSLHAYPDPATGGAPWTIGYGHCGPEVVPGMIWTEDQADLVLRQDVNAFEKIVNTFASTGNMTQGQFDALVSFCFNVGPGKKGVKDGLVQLKNGYPSSLLMLTNKGKFTQAAAQFGLWTKGNGKVMLGLVRRRASERALYEGKDALMAIAAGKTIGR